LCIDAQGGHFQHLLWQPHFVQVWHANVNQHANVLYFCYFCNSTFSGATREWDALYLFYVTNNITKVIARPVGDSSNIWHENRWFVNGTIRYRTGSRIIYVLSHTESFRSVHVLTRRFCNKILILSFYGLVVPSGLHPLYSKPHNIKAIILP
jgi:hypothetical protein